MPHSSRVFGSSRTPSSSCRLLVALSLVAASALAAAGCSSARADETIPSVSEAPNVPPPVGRRGPAVIHVDLDASMRRVELVPGVLYDAWTFGGHVPSPFIRARVGDTLEVTVSNSHGSMPRMTSMEHMSHGVLPMSHDGSDMSDMKAAPSGTSGEVGMPHNLDFHAVMAPGGGSIVTTAVPGEKKTARFKLLYPGLFVYHCGTPPVMDHLANGMYGLILVEPEGGLPKVDREYYVMQSEFYATPPDPETHVAAYSHEAGLREDPTYILYNGDRPLFGRTALTAHTGERVRLFFGNAGPNKPASIHIVGLVLDKVYREGDLLSAPAQDLQTTLVPPGGAAVLEFVPQVPGTFTLMDHAIFRMEKGAMAQIRVEGAERPDIYSSVVR
jgi:copper-containing nitrite reductase